jgi:hypothetical protein
MLGNFINGLSPVAFIAILFAATLSFTLVGYRVGRRIVAPHNSESTSALGTALAAIFGIVALVLSFSFSFALARYEQRWQLVVQEANNIGTMYLRTSFLDARPRSTLRALLRVYNQERIEYYLNDNNPEAQRRAANETDRLKRRMWTLVSDAVRARPGYQGTSLLMQITNDTIDISAEQRAALVFRLQGSALFLVFFVALLGAGAVGLAFGVANWHNWLVSIAFSLLLTILVYTIIDLDSPQSGFVRVNLTPLYQQQQSMIPEAVPR